MLKHGKKILLPFAAAFALAACDEGTRSDTARMTIRLHDAPGDLAEAWVRIDQIYFQGEGGDGGRVVLMDTPTEWIDLTELSGGNFATLVEGVPVPAGSYNQLRFVVCEAYVVTEDGDVFATRDADLPSGVTADGTLQVPSGCQSGFKVNLPNGGIDLENESMILNVDFDVSQSFGHQAGRSGMWVMHPVMTATEVGFTGRISGTVALGSGVTLPACGGAATDLTHFVPLAVAGLDSISATVSAAGQYAINVTPGTYSMTFVPDVTFTNGDSLTFAATATPPSVSVASGGATTSNYSITAATCH